MTDRKLTVQYSRARPWLLVAITVILTGWALQATGSFMIPVVFSVFLALLVAPIDHWVASRVPGKLAFLGHVAAMGAILTVILVFVGFIWFAAQQTVERFPDATSGGSLLPDISELSGEQESSSTQGENNPLASITPHPTDEATSSDEQLSSFERSFRQIEQIFLATGGSFVGWLGSWASSIASQTLSAVGTTLMAVILVIFLTLIMLIEASTWQQKVVNVLDDQAREDAMNSIQIIADRLRSYLLARTIIAALTAGMYAGWLWIFGVDLLVVWALLAFLLSYIPTFGSLVSGALPVIYGFVQKDFGTAMAIGAGILAIEQVMGNYVDPRVQGRQVSLSSLVVLVTLLVWTWMWGVAGAILAVPITIAAMIICAHIPPLRSFALILSNASDFDELDRQTSGQTGRGMRE